MAGPEFSIVQAIGPSRGGQGVLARCISGMAVEAELVLLPDCGAGRELGGRLKTQPPGKMYKYHRAVVGWHQVNCSDVIRGDAN